jgi:hypothetical protein
VLEKIWLTASMSIVLVSEGTREANRNKIAAHGLSPVLLQRSQEISELYQAWGTPSAVMVRPDGAIGSRVAQGADAIRKLVAWAGSSPGTHVDGGKMNGNGAAAVPTLSYAFRATAGNLAQLLHCLMESVARKT